MSSVKRFLEADPKPTWEGKELLIMSKCVSLTSLRSHNNTEVAQPFSLRIRSTS